MKITEHSNPWYTYPILWMMLFIPFVAVVRGIGMIWISVVTADGLVIADYYKHGREINLVIERDLRASELGVSAVIDFDNNSRAITMQFNKGLLAYYPASFNLHLEHVTREKSDVNVLLHRGIGDQYIGYVKYRISEGVWHFRLDDSDWRLSQRVFVKSYNRVELQGIF